MNVLLGVTGSIAAYKAAELVRLMRKREWDVRVVMTEGGTQFITPLTLQTLSRNPVYVGMFEQADWQPDHISLTDWADVLLIAPCTANVLSKLAHGLADDLLSCTALAHAGPVVLAPAMNDRMWAHPATVSNVECLQARGCTLVDVGTGDLACGYQSSGRLADLEEIIGAVARVCDASRGV